jgi:hypothetical protein
MRGLEGEEILLSSFFFSHTFFSVTPLRAGAIIFRNSVFFDVQATPSYLAHQNRKRYLFLGGKGVFLCFCARKKTPLDTLSKSIRTEEYLLRE